LFANLGISHRGDRGGLMSDPEILIIDELSLGLALPRSISSWRRSSN
jgi:hypothetical protein